MNINYGIERYGKWYKIFFVITGVIVPAFGGLVVIPAVAFLLFSQEMKYGMLIMFFSAGVFCLFYAWRSFVFGLATYEIAVDGLLIKIPIKKQYKITFKEFQEICIDYVARTTRGEPRADKAIVFVKKGEKPNFLGFWKTNRIIYSDKVIACPYKEELYNWMKENCDIKILDIRKPWEIDRYEAGWLARMQKKKKKN